MSESPVIELGETVTRVVLPSAWDAQNFSYLSNQCAEELMVVRSNAREELIPNILHYGASMGADEDTFGPVKKEFAW